MPLLPMTTSSSSRVKASGAFSSMFLGDRTFAFRTFAQPIISDGETAPLNEFTWIDVSRKKVFTYFCDARAPQVEVGVDGMFHSGSEMEPRAGPANWLNKSIAPANGFRFAPASSGRPSC